MDGDHHAHAGGAKERDSWHGAMREMASLWVRAQPIVSAYFAASVLDRQHVEDLVQEVAETAIERFNSFDRDRSFTAWVMGIARNRLLKYYRSQTRSRLVLSESALEQLAQAMEEVEPEAEARREALRECMKVVSGRRKEVVDLRYGSGASVGDIGRQYAMSPTAVSVMLHRVRLSLQDCIRRRTADSRG